MLKILSIFIVLLILVHIIGCGADEDEAEVIENIPVNMVSVTPPGGEIVGNATITLTFDNIPAGVTSTIGNATISGKTVQITGPFKPGNLDFTVTWVGGSRELNFHVTGL